MRTSSFGIAAGVCLLLLTLGLSPSGFAQDESKPATEGATSEDAPEKAGDAAPVAAEPPAPAVAPGPDLAALARALGAERRVLRTDRGEFGVIAATAESEQAAGTVVLLPADGQFPGASPGIARLRAEMPAAGWATWLLELEAPPRVQSLGTPGTPAAAEAANGTTPPADANKSDTPAEQPAPDAAQPAEGSSEAPPAAAPADKGTEGAALSAEAAEAAVEAPALALDRRLGAAHAEWIDRNRARVAAALAEAAKAGPVVLVAEGSASPVLLAALDRAEGLAALVLLAPVPLDEAPFAWPAKLPLPVLEVLEPGASPKERAGSRERAHAASIETYRLMLLAMDSPSVGPRESLLTRRVRGWLRSLSSRDDG
jgi:hypothetical protein